MDYSAAYGKMHRKTKTFQGYSIKPHVDAIAELVFKTTPDRILDYGCGKGHQYLGLRVHERWGGLLPHCYDVGIPVFAQRPEGVFQGVICTDVMEHIAEEDVDDILDDIFSFLDHNRPSFAFFSIDCAPAYRKRLPDSVGGGDVHVTVKPPAWWRLKLRRFVRPGLTIETVFKAGRNETRDERTD